MGRRVLEGGRYVVASVVSVAGYLVSFFIILFVHHHQLSISFSPISIKLLANTFLSEPTISDTSKGLLSGKPPT